LDRWLDKRASGLRRFDTTSAWDFFLRRSGRRDYDPDAVAQLAVVQFALSTGFTLRDTRKLVGGFPPETAASARWCALTATRIQELDEQIARGATMKALLQRISANCTCDTLSQCGRGLARSRERWSVPKARSVRRDA